MPVNLLVPNIRPSDRDVPIFQPARNPRNTCKTPCNRNLNSRLDANRLESLLAFHKSSLKDQLLFINVVNAVNLRGHVHCPLKQSIVLLVCTFYVFMMQIASKMCFELKNVDENIFKNNSYVT